MKRSPAATVMEQAANTPGTCIMIFAIMISMLALGFGIAAANIASQTREYFCVDLRSTGDASTVSIQFHLETHALNYLLRYRPDNPSAQLNLLQILKSGVLVSELCSGADCMDIEQTTCAELGEPAHCGALAADLLDAELARDMRRYPLLYSWHAETTDATLDSVSLGALCPFF
jgi:hypothetical protein